MNITGDLINYIRQKQTTFLVALTYSKGLIRLQAKSRRSLGIDWNKEEHHGKKYF